MKNFFKSIISHILGLAARSVVRRYGPRIVMVTGSVGKTSTKDAVAAALTSQYLVRKSEKSFNSEFGVPFTILGVGNPWGNPLAWGSVVKSALALLVLPNHFPNMLVLEVGADKPGDLARILKIATPDAVVVTRLPDIPVHVEAYTSPEAVQEEEFSPAHTLPAGAPLIVCADKPHVLQLAKATSAHVHTYGVSVGAMSRIAHIAFDTEGTKVLGMKADITLEGETHTVYVKGAVGTTQILPLAAALATASALGISLANALTSLTDYEPPLGRGRVLDGIHGSTLIDDTYNASPAAVEEALSTLKSFPHAKRRIAVLGDMLELGRYSILEHERIGKIAGASADLVVTVGIRSRSLAAKSKKSETISFNDSSTAALALKDIVQEGDVILVKGSQSIRTERIVEALLAHPADASKLVRQEREWKMRS